MRTRPWSVPGIAGATGRPGPVSGGSAAPAETAPATTTRRTLSVRRTMRLGAALLTSGVLAGATALAGAGPASAATPTGTEITVAHTVFGTALVVGSGPFAGFSLYMITSDHGHQFGCTATTVQTIAGPFLCTGPSTDKNAEWPAITTKGAPVAGPGVNPALLGSVGRLHVGRQVTYAGHPLYLFDQFPGAVSGESWDEPGLPPWHGIWTLVAPSGKAAPWAGTLTVTTLPNGRKVVAAQMNTGIGTVNFPLYSYSRDTRWHSACDTGACARRFPLMLTSGRPGVTRALLRFGPHIGTLHTAAGTQVVLNGRPLYFFSNEQIIMTASGFAPAGNGNGVTFAGGTFSLVAP
jgi:predicted lipoprotein with Yx(FWY)xxD motif